MVLPLSLPGMFAGVLLTFVSVAADYVNAAILGGTGNTMIGNIIQDEFLNVQDYPTGAALSFRGVEVGHIHMVFAADERRYAGEGRRVDDHLAAILVWR